MLGLGYRVEGIYGLRVLSLGFMQTAAFHEQCLRIPTKSFSFMPTWAGCTGFTPKLYRVTMQLVNGYLAGLVGRQLDMVECWRYVRVCWRETLLFFGVGIALAARGVGPSMLVWWIVRGLCPGLRCLWFKSSSLRVEAGATNPWLYICDAGRSLRTQQPLSPKCCEPRGGPSR